MKKTVIIFIILFLSVSFNVCGETFEFYQNEESKLFNQLYSDYNIGELVEETPDEVRDYLDSFGITPENPFSFSELFSSDGLDKLLDYITAKLTSPIRNIGIIIISIIVCSLINSMSSEKSESGFSLNMICGMVCITTVLLPVSSLISSCIEAVNTMAVFMGVFIPIFAGILIACIKSATAVSYSSIMFFTCEAISFCCSSVVLPFSNCFLALSLTSGITDNNKLSGIIKLIKKLLFIVITSAMAVFLSVLSVQTAITGVSDNALTKTTKFFISSFVPIIGPAVSEALGSIKGCIGLIRSSVGIYAVIIIVLLLLPILIQLMIYKLSLTICADVAGLFSVDTIRKICDSINSTLSIILSVVICVALMFVFSITILCVTGGVVS